MGHNRKNYVNNPKIVEHTYIEGGASYESAINIIKNTSLTQKDAITLAYAIKKLIDYSSYYHPEDLQWLAIKSLDWLLLNSISCVWAHLADDPNMDNILESIHKSNDESCACCGVSIKFDVAPSGRKYYIFTAYHD